MPHPESLPPDSSPVGATTGTVDGQLDYSFPAHAIEVGRQVTLGEDLQHPFTEAELALEGLYGHPLLAEAVAYQAEGIQPQARSRAPKSTGDLRLHARTVRRMSNADESQLIGLAQDVKVATEILADTDRLNRLLATINTSRATEVILSSDALRVILENRIVAGKNARDILLRSSTRWIGYAVRSRSYGGAQG